MNRGRTGYLGSSRSWRLQLFFKDGKQRRWLPAAVVTAMLRKSHIKVLRGRHNTQSTVYTSTVLHLGAKSNNPFVDISPRLRGLRIVHSTTSLNPRVELSRQANIATLDWRGSRKLTHLPLSHIVSSVRTRSMAPSPHTFASFQTHDLVPHSRHGRRAPRTDILLEVLEMLGP